MAFPQEEIATVVVPRLVAAVDGVAELDAPARFDEVPPPALAHGDQVVDQPGVRRSAVFVADPFAPMDVEPEGVAVPQDDPALGFLPGRVFRTLFWATPQRVELVPVVEGDDVERSKSDDVSVSDSGAFESTRCSRTVGRSTRGRFRSTHFPVYSNRGRVTVRYPGAETATRQPKTFTRLPSLTSLTVSPRSRSHAIQPAPGRR